MADGHLNKCKECTKKDVRKDYESNREKHREYERQRFQRPERKAKALEYQRRRRAQHPEKNEARNIVSNALRDGRLKRPPCEVCGNPKPQAHHDDYGKPLEVKWLCFNHHRELHGQQVG